MIVFNVSVTGPFASGKTHNLHEFFEQIKKNYPNSVVRKQVAKDVVTPDMLGHEHLLITVVPHSDQNPNLDPDEYERIFDAYSRV